MSDEDRSSGTTAHSGHGTHVVGDPRGGDAEHVYEPTAEELEEAERPRRSLWGLVALVTVIVVIIIVLMLLRDCGGVRSAVSKRGGKSIESIKGYDPMDGAISLWLSEETSLDAVLSAAGVSATGRLDMGDGRWVLDVPPGTEKGAITALTKQQGVHDAGRVYER